MLFSCRFHCAFSERLWLCVTIPIPPSSILLTAKECVIFLQLRCFTHGIQKWCLFVLAVDLCSIFHATIHIFQHFCQGISEVIINLCFFYHCCLSFILVCYSFMHSLSLGLFFQTQFHSEYCFLLPSL